MKRLAPRARRETEGMDGEAWKYSACAARAPRDRRNGRRSMEILCLRRARAARPTNEKNRQSETRARHRRRRVPRLAGLLAVLGFQLAAEATHLYASWRVYSLRQEFSELALACIVVGTLPVVVAFLAKISAQYSRVVLVVWWTLAVRRPRPSRPRTSCRKSELGNYAIIDYNIGHVAFVWGKGG